MLLLKRQLSQTFTFFLIFTIPLVTLGGQNIVGQLIDQKNGSPVVSANIILFHKENGQQVAGASSDQDGWFSLADPGPGQYELRIRVIGYKPRRLPDIKVAVSGESLNLGKIFLEPKSINLPDVSASFEKQEMILSPDKKVYRVDKSLANGGGTASDVLENIPSVTVDVDGNVSLRGDENVRLLIDGKPSIRLGLDPASALQQISSDMIDRVEVITNPSARYDAEGQAGIINLVMKKQRKNGLNGSVNIFTGSPLRYGSSINLNYRVKKINLFLTESARYRSHEGGGDLYQEFYSGQPYATLKQNSDYDRSGWSNNLRPGFEYLPNDKDSFTFSVFNYYGEDDNESKVRYHYSDQNGVLLTDILRTNPEDATERWNGIDAGFRHQYDKKGHELTMDYKFETGSDEEISTVEEEYLSDPGNTSNFFQDVFNREEETTHLIQMDYVNPYSDNGKIEAGLKGNLKDLNHQYNVREDASNPSQYDLQNLNNRLNFIENIYAVYFTYASRIGLFSWQLGVRGEYSDVSTDFEVTNEKNDRQYFNLFPSAHFNLEYDTDNSFQLSYSRRLRRPRYWLLIPFWHYADSRNIRQGNPNLDPEYTDAYEIGHTYENDKSSISTSAYYKHSTDVIEFFQEATDSITTMRPYNLATREAYGFEWIASTSIRRWVTIQGNFNFYKAYTRGEFQGQSYDTEYYGWFTRGSVRTMFSREYGSQIRFFYHGPRETLQGKRKSMYMLDLGLSRSFLKGNGKVTLSVRDLLNTRKRRSETFAETFYSSSEYSRHGRTISLQFTYIFNQDKRDRKRNQDMFFEDGFHGEPEG